MEKLFDLLFSKPPQIEEVYWREFVSSLSQYSLMSLLIILPFAVAVFWLLSRLWFRVNHSGAVFDLNKPWWISLGSAVVLEWVAIFFPGLSIFEGTISSGRPIVSALAIWAIVMALLQSLAYLLVTLFISPSKVRYAVPLKYRLMSGRKSNAN